MSMRIKISELSRSGYLGINQKGKPLNTCQPATDDFINSLPRGRKTFTLQEMLAWMRESKLNLRISTLYIFCRIHEAFTEERIKKHKTELELFKRAFLTRSTNANKRTA